MIGLRSGIGRYSGRKSSILTQGLLAWYKMDEGSGSTLINSGSLSGANMTTTGSPTWVTGGLRFVPNTSKAATGTFATQTLNDFSVYVVFKWESSIEPSSGTSAGMLGGDWSSTFNIRQSNSVIGRAGYGVNGLNSFNLVSIKDDTWHVMAITRSGSTASFYIDDIYVGGATEASALTLTKLQWGLNNGFTIPSICGQMLVYNTFHTKAQVRQQRNALASIMAERSIDLPVTNKLFMQVGDSIIKFAVPRMEILSSLNSRIGVNRAVPGTDISYMVSDAGNVDDYINSSRSKHILQILVGNGITTPSEWVDSLKNYCLARRAAGWNHINICTLLPRTTSGFNANRAVVNSLIKADSSFWDSLTRLDEDATMGPDAAASNTTYYGDGVHPTTVGNDIIAPLLVGSINSAW